MAKGSATEGPALVVWGDSHADQLKPLFIETGSKNGLRVMELSFPGCPLIPGVQRRDVSGVDCSENDRVLEYLLSDRSIELVILHAYWQHYIDGRNAYLLGEGIESGLRRLVSRLSEAGKDIILIGPVPKHPVNPRLFMAKAALFGESYSSTLSREHYLDEIRKSRAVLSSLASTLANVKLFDHGDFICETKTCRIESEGSIFYRDSNHLSPAAGVILEDPLNSIVGELSHRE